MYIKAKELYEKWGVDTEAAMEKCADIPVSLHCWQGDDVQGFEKGSIGASGGIQTTGDYPWRANNKVELMADLDFVFRLIPGKKRLNLHAVYAITETDVDRDELEPRHFEEWLDWALRHGAGLDLNPTLFSHPLATDGMTLSHPDATVRDFWIRHIKACRKIAAFIGERQGTPCLNNIWIPDGLKNPPADRLSARLRLRDTLDDIFSVAYDKRCIIDTLESKVFGIGLENYTVGSSEFYIAYAATRGVNVLLDNGHYHPTESIADKLPALLTFFEKVALHLTHHVRWDSDHVVLFDDEIKDIAVEIIRNNAEDRVLIGLDYFDASINRIAAWVTGARNAQKSLLYALLLPHDGFKRLQETGNFSKLLAMQEEAKTLPFSAVWNEYLVRQNLSPDWFESVEQYEQNILSKRTGDR
ncbi:MAG: L-rhamnose isomerase [Treponema sp.]|jgi:L-rhamnose isomerase|nr:L-rhamnose isomerase [Treponema sp.]